MARSLARWSVQIVVVLAFGFAWQWAASTGRLDVYLVSSPERVWTVLRRWNASGLLWSNLWATVVVALAGYVFASLFGAAIGVLVGASRTTSTVAQPFLAFLNGMPRLVMFPFFVIALGFGYVSKIAFVLFVVLFIVIISVATAFGGVDRLVLDNLRLMGASRAAVVWHVYLPSMVGTVVNMSRLTLSLSLAATVLTEFVGSYQGLGVLLSRGQSLLRADEVMATLVVIFVVAVAGDSLLSSIESRATRWSGG